MRKLTGVCLAGAAIAAVPAAAQQSAEDQLRTIQGCRTIAEPDARLACFERTSAPTPLIAEAPRATRAARATGVAAPSRAIAAAPAMPDKRLGAQLVSVRQAGPGSWQFALDDGTRWRMTESKSVLDLPHAGSKITVRHTALGGYLLDWGGASVRVEPAS